MLIRALTKKDIPDWLALAHEGDDVVRGLNADIIVFYEGFDEFMARKIEQHEASMAADSITGRCLGIVAFSKNHNRITFLGVFKNADFQKVGRKLMETALNQLDDTKEITVNVIKSAAIIIKKERALYERFRFFVSTETVKENGVHVVQMKLIPGKMVSVN
ncbi:MAG: GNAT family N-acetyltransferase [Dehalococcoidales bacterium]